VGTISLGCIEGLRPIGWSGGVVDGGQLYVGSKEGRLVAVDIVDQSRNYSEALKVESAAGFLNCVPAGGGCAEGALGVAIYGTPAISGGLAFIGGYNGKMYAFYADTLEMKWDYPPEDNLEPLIGGPVLGNNMVYFGGSDGWVYALDAETRKKQWDFQTGDKIWSTPAIDGSTLYIGSFDKKLYALDVYSGKVKWEFEAEGAIAATPLVKDNTVYIGSFDRHLYALDAASGKLKWKFMGENWFWAKPLSIDDNVIAGCLDSKVYVLQAATGSKVAEFNLDSPVSSSPVVVGNSVIIASQKGLIYSLDTISWELKQIADIEEKVYGPLHAHDGIVYIHTQDLTLHRVNAETGAVLMFISLKSTE